VSSDSLPSSALGSIAAALRVAGNRDDARWAATDLARVAVDDAGAVTPQAAEIVAAVRRLVEDGCRWRADVFAMLLYVLGHAHPHEADASGQAVLAALGGFDGLVRSLIVDPDPETRSLACLLLGWISTAPAVDHELLRMVREAEVDDRARACAAEAGLRMAGPGEALALLDDPSPVVRRRVARFFVPALHSPDPEDLDPVVAAQARAVLSEQAAAGEAPLWWQAEMI